MIGSDPEARFLAPLLDRLTSDGGDGWVTAEVLQESVRRDLEWLLNTQHLEGAVSLAGLDQVKTSVANFGIKSIAGRASEIEAQLAAAVERAIRVFDSRLRSVRVQADLGRSSPAPEVLSLRIEAELMVQPEPIRVRMVAHRDETFQVSTEPDAAPDWSSVGATR